MSSSSSRTAFWVGTGIVVASHLYMAIVGLPASQMMAHAILNLLASVLIIIGSMKK